MLNDKKLTMPLDCPTQEALEHFYEMGWEVNWLKEVDDTLRPKNAEYRGRMEATFRLLNLASNPAGSVLDVGCGIGVYAINLAKRWPKIHIVGFDLSKRQIGTTKRLAREQNVASRCEFFVGDANTVSPWKSFDFVMCTEVLEHLPSPAQALVNIRNMGAENTIYVFSVPQFYNGRRQSGVFYKQILSDGQEVHTQERTKLVEGVPIYEYYHALYTVRDVSNLLQSCGFEIEQIVGYGFVIPPWRISVGDSVLKRITAHAHNAVAKTVNFSVGHLSHSVHRYFNRLFNQRQASNLIIRCHQRQV